MKSFYGILETFAKARRISFIQIEIFESESLRGKSGSKNCYAIFIKQYPGEYFMYIHHIIILMAAVKVIIEKKNHM